MADDPPDFTWAPSRTDGTWHDLVRSVPGGATLTDDECEVILWEHTCYPLGPPELIQDQARAVLAGEVDR